MSTLDHDEQQLRPWAHALADAVERDIARFAPVPDLADVFARARAQDPAAVPPGWDAFADEVDDDDVMPLSRMRAMQAGGDPGVAAFAVALRGVVERDLHERDLAAIPQAPALRRRRPAVWAAAGATVLAMAAALVLWLASPALLQSPQLRSRIDGDTASRTLQRDRARAEWTARRAAAPTPKRPTPTVVPPPTEQLTTPAPTPMPTARRPADDLDALEAEAERAWQAGELELAERTLQRIARKAGRSRRAELAYADLFALARQRRGSAGQVAMWKAYLARFPRGEFADDARAGICHRASDTNAVSACWADYLVHHPRGAHVSEAERWRATPP